MRRPPTSAHLRRVPRTAEGFGRRARRRAHYHLTGWGQQLNRKGTLSAFNSSVRRISIMSCNMIAHSFFHLVPSIQPPHKKILPPLTPRISNPASHSLNLSISQSLQASSFRRPFVDNSFIHSSIYHLCLSCH